MSTIETIHAADTGRAARFWRGFAASGFLHVVLVLLGVTMVLPFLWMVLTSLKSITEVGEPNWMPEVFRWSNYTEVFETIPFARFYWNSIFVAAWVTFLQVFTSSLAAFSFSRVRWQYCP
jgi:ABC-type glycerol-3-phosphate transport system permease component